ncbi:MAG: hypothetical protein ACI89J_003332 [Hyphomicrobiaceae bacterium]|jgi:hypothetical protein
MTTSIRSPGISFELERYCSLRGNDDVCHTLVKTSVEIHQVRKIAALPDKLHPVRAALHYFEPHTRYVPTQHLAPSPATKPHSTR